MRRWAGHLREFTGGHVAQLASVTRAHLVDLVEHSELLPGREEGAFIDVDSLLRPVYGHAKEGASYGHTKIASRRAAGPGRLLRPAARALRHTRGRIPVLAATAARGDPTVAPAFAAQAGELLAVM